MSCFFPLQLLDGMGAQHRGFLRPGRIHHLRGLHVLPQHPAPAAPPPGAPLRAQGAERRAAASHSGQWGVGIRRPPRPLPPTRSPAPPPRGVFLRDVRSPRRAALRPGERAHLFCPVDGCGGGVGAVCRPLGVWSHVCIAGTTPTTWLLPAYSAWLLWRSGRSWSHITALTDRICVATGPRLAASGRRAYSAQEDVLLSQPDVAMTSTAGSANKADGESTKCGHSSAESSYTNKSAPSVRNSTHGSKLTNLHAEAAQCKSPSAPVTANGAAILDNSLTEHSVDNEIKMHVAPVEVQFCPMNNITIPAAPTNGHTSRHHKNRARAHRASRLTVLREYSYDVPTSVDGSVQSASHRRHHHYDLAARNSRRAAYMAYRERHQSQLQQDSSDSASLPRRSRYSDKGGGGGSVGTLGNGTAVPVGTVVTVETEQVAAVVASSPSKDSVPVNQPSGTELESQPKSYGLNLITQNGGTLKENGQAVPLIRHGECGRC